MQSEKGTGRWYDDACGSAMALELVGERWALLIVRELMFGARRFGELRVDLPGISANVLTRRLEGLIAAGIAIKRRLPPPASVAVYELTSWGYEAEPILQVTGRWAARSPDHDPSLPLSAASLMLSFRTMIARDRVGERATIGFRFGAQAFVATLDDEGIAIARGDPGGADAVLDADPMTIASIVYGGRSIGDAERAALLTLHGNRALVERFVTLFPLPEKVRG